MEEVMYMRCLSLSVSFFLIFGCGAVASAQGTNDLGEDPHPSVQAQHMIGRYVFASGSVAGASNENCRHWATAGEMFVGSGQGGNISLQSGFWSPVSTLTEVDQQEDVPLPKALKLHQNYPNPFNPQTLIHYDLPKTCLVTIEIFNVVGQRIRLLSDSQSQGPGSAQAVWDGRDDQGRTMGSGVYFYSVTAAAGSDEVDISFRQTRKMVLVK